MDWKRAQEPMEVETKEKVIGVDKVEKYLRNGGSFVANLNEESINIKIDPPQIFNRSESEKFGMYLLKGGESFYWNPEFMNNGTNITLLFNQNYILDTYIYMYYVLFQLGRKLI